MCRVVPPAQKCERQSSDAASPVPTRRRHSVGAAGVRVQKRERQSSARQVARIRDATARRQLLAGPLQRRASSPLRLGRHVQESAIAPVSCPRRRASSPLWIGQHVHAPATVLASLHGSRAPSSESSTSSSRPPPRLAPLPSPQRPASAVGATARKWRQVLPPSSPLPCEELAKLQRLRFLRFVHSAQHLGAQLPHEACPESPSTSSSHTWARSLWSIGLHTQEAALLVSLAQDPNEEYKSGMEDGHTILDPILQDAQNGERWGFFAVYDGHGGAMEMKFCEAHLHDLVSCELLDPVCAVSSTVASAFRTAFAKADAELAELGSFKSGCTATVAMAKRLPQGGVELHIGNVGDSRALLVGAFGTRRLSIDHRTSDYSELMRIKHARGFVYNSRVGGRLSVTRSLGDHYLKPSVSGEPDVCAYTCKSPDEVVALVVASDGLWDVIDDDEVQELLTQCLHDASTGDLDNALGAAAVAELQASSGRVLAEKAKAMGSRDNITVLVAFF